LSLSGLDRRNEESLREATRMKPRKEADPKDALKNALKILDRV